jgi:acetylcholinesterase
LEVRCYYFWRGPILTVVDDTNEGSGFAVDAASPLGVTEFFLNNYPKLVPDSAETITSHYPLQPALPLHKIYFPSASEAYGDSTFTCYGNAISSHMSSLLSPDKVWNYRYNVQDEFLVSLGLGVPHTFESPAIFGVGNAGDDLNSSYTTYNQGIVPVVMNYWISFVKNLDPNSYKYAEAPVWASWGTGTGRRLMLETNRTKMEALPLEQVEKCEFWRGLGDEMRH